MTETRLSFKQMCARFDVTPRTLRYYEYIELLDPEREGRSRFYGPREVARMTLILRGRRFGFSLEEIRQWLEMHETEGTVAQLQFAADACERQIGVLGEQAGQLAADIEDLRSLNDQIKRDLEAAKKRENG